MPLDADALLATPLGLPGSGRVRYGAAMALFQAGRIGEAQLEVYRIASARDEVDPAILMAERGLPAPPSLVWDADRALSRLAESAEEYLARLACPGAAEVRLAFARRAERPRPTPARANSVVETWLNPALASLAPEEPDLAAAIAAASPHLAWTTYDAYPLEEIGEAFAAGHAFASLIGETAAFPATDFDAGLFLIAPHVLYRDHSHPAPELYAPLTGPHGWRFGPDRPLVMKNAHVPVWNDPDRPHGTKVGRVPFLALYAWTRDVDRPARIVPASDWPQLEALRLSG